MTGFDIVGMLLMVITPILLIVTIVRGLRRKPHKILGCVTIGCCITCIVCAYLAPSVPRDESPAPTQEVAEVETTPAPVVETPAPAEVIVEADKSPEEVQTPTQEVFPEITTQEETGDSASVETVPDIDPILVELGLLEVYPYDTVQNGKMEIVRARIYDSEDMQLNITYEDGVIIYVQLTNILYDAGGSWSNRTDQLHTGTSDFHVPDVEMYNDSDGVLAVLDWDKRTIKRK